MAQDLLIMNERSVKGEDAMIDAVAKQDELCRNEAEFTDLMDSLLVVLKKEVEVYEELRSITIEGTRVITGFSLENLSDSQKKMETCVLKAKMLEEVRGNIVKKVARKMEKDEREINLSLLSLYANKAQALELRNQQRKLAPLIESVRNNKEKYTDLIEYSLSYMKNSFNFINGLLFSAGDYARTGKLKSAGLNGRVFCKEG